MAKSAPNLIQLARQEAARFQHEYVATKHLLLALASMSGTAAARAMASRGIHYDALLVTVQQFVTPDLGEVPIDESPYTPYTMRAIEGAIEAARGLGHNRVEPEHVLLALIGDDQNGAVMVLQSLGVSPESVRHTVLHEKGWI